MLGLPVCRKTQNLTGNKNANYIKTMQCGWQCSSFNDLWGNPIPQTQSRQPQLNAQGIT